MKRLIPLVVLVLAVSGLVSGCSRTAQEPIQTPTPTVSLPTLTPTTPTPTPASTALDQYISQKLNWTTCEKVAECAQLLVPIDYNNPQSGNLQLALIRRPARDPKLRKGSIVVNPGGPGGSGYDYVKSSGKILGPTATLIYDVVGFDPRGVSRSSPVKCLTAEQTDRFYSSDGSPETDAQATQAFLLGREFAKSCDYSAPGLLGFLGTRESAQDLNILRAALGEKKLNYVGKSYGTFLGAEFAQRFPTKVGRMVLDGAIDPNLDADGFAAGQSTGFERALQAFLKDCVTRASCALGRSTERAQKRLNLFFKQLDATPETVGNRKLTQALGILGVAASLYSKSSWPVLRSALSQGLQGNGAGLLALSDYYSNRNPDGTYADNSLDAFYAISCMDRADTKGIDATQALATKLTENNSSTFGSFIAWGDTPCQSWPVKATLQAGKITATGSGPIVVVGTTRDPATPIEWAQSLAAQLQNGVFVARDGDGHTGYRQGSSCVDQAVDLYLTKGTAPQDGLFCA